MLLHHHNAILHLVRDTDHSYSFPFHLNPIPVGAKKRYSFTKFCVTKIYDQIATPIV